MSEDIEIEVGGDEPVPDVGALTAKGLSFGIFEGVAEAEYFRLPAINSSLLRQFNGRTPAHVREYIRRPPGQSPAQAIGSAYHALALGQPTFADFVLLPPGENRTHKAGRAAKDAGKKSLRDVEVEALQKMKAALYAHPTIAAYLLAPSSRKELTVVWRELVELDGVQIEVPCKARLDVEVWVGAKIAADLKSTRNAEARAFATSVADYDYHEQGAWYMRGLEKVGAPADHFVIVAQEKRAPYLPKAWRLDEQALAQGQLQADRNLLTLVRCLRNDEWPGYDEGLDDIALPAWKLDPALKSKTFEEIAQKREEREARRI